MATYQDKKSHSVIENSNCECDKMENMETYSKEVKIGKKKVKITLEFPYTVDPKNVDIFESMLKEIYIEKIKKGSIQSSLKAVSFPPPRGQCESNSHKKENLQGGMNHD